MSRKIILSLMLLLTLCGVSSADFVYMTSAGSLGAIRINSSSDIYAPSLEYAGNFSSPLLTSYWNGSSSRIMVIDRLAGVSGDRAYIFNPNNLTSYEKSEDLKGVYGAEKSDFSENGYSLFLTIGAKIYNVSTRTFSVLNSFDCASVISNDTGDTGIEDILVSSSYIHAIASAGDARRYVRFDGQLKRDVRIFLSADLPSGACELLTTANGYPVAAHSYGLDIMERGRKFYRILSTDQPVKAMCPDESKSFFYATQRQDGSKYVNTITHYLTGSSFTPAEIESSSPNISLVQDNAHKETFAAMTDEAVYIFTYKNGVTLALEYTASDLGGTPVGITTASVSGYNGSSSSSSGCNASWPGLAVIGLVLLAMRRK